MQCYVSILPAGVCVVGDALVLFPLRKEPVELKAAQHLAELAVGFETTTTTMTMAARKRKERKKRRTTRMERYVSCA